MEFGPDELVVEVEPGPRDQGLVVGGDEQWERLGQSLQEDLLWGVDGHDPYPWHVFVGCVVRPAGALEAVAEDFVEGELAGGDLGEARAAEVQP
ncbi:hypothetical protein GCM10023085_63210 [Actinomadura viridis]